MRLIGHFQINNRLFIGETQMNPIFSAESLAENALESANVRHQIAERAYYLSQERGFAAGRELDFWLQAEVETLQIISVAPLPNEAAPVVKRPVRRAPKTVAADAETTPAPKAAPRKRTPKAAIAPEI